MFLGDAEVDELIQITRDLIDSEPTSILLNRVDWVRSSSGGQVRGNPAPEAGGAKDRWFAGIVADAARVFREQGEMIVVSHVIIGMPDDDIREKDTFSLGNRKFEVVEIEPARQFQIKGWVVERASDGAT